MKKEDLQVVIPIPSDVPRARGIHATTKFGAIVQTRLHRDERNLIEEEADKLGLSKSAFLRWCAVKVAEQLKLRSRSNGTDEHEADRAVVQRS